jgi:hypothetical protein
MQRVSQQPGQEGGEPLVALAALSQAATVE